MSSQIFQLKNKEKGKRCFILANGPSLLKCDLSKLLDEDIIIGMNASTKVEEDVDICSDYYVVSDTRFLDNPKKKIYATEKLSKRTIRVFREELITFDDMNYSDRTYYVKSLGRNGFSFDLEKGYYFGCTTTMLAIQLAYYLGCSEIFLLGVDLNYLNGSTRFYEEENIEFPDPFISVQIHNLILAKDHLLMKKVFLHNCSEDSFIRPYLGYIDFKEVLAQ